jgi:hypothetical protein
MITGHLQLVDTTFVTSSCTRLLPTNRALQLWRQRVVFLRIQSDRLNGLAPLRGQCQVRWIISTKPEHEIHNDQNWNRLCRLAVESVLSSKGAWSEHCEANECRSQLGYIWYQSLITNTRSMRSSVGVVRSLLQVNSRPHR